MTEKPSMPQTETRKLDADHLWAMIQPSASSEELTYFPAPPNSSDKGITWRIRLELAFNSQRCMGLDIQDEVVLGRGGGGSGDAVISLNNLDGEALGVSRQHVMLRPTQDALYVMDLDSTNGSWLNGHPIGMKSPYSLSHGDRLRLGELALKVRIVRHPGAGRGRLTESDDEDWALMTARGITSQLHLTEVFKQTIELTRRLTGADEASVWLVNERTGELALEAEQGVNEETGVHLLRLSVSDSLAGQVVTSGKPMRVSRQTAGERIKLKTGYLVDAVLYVPIAAGGVTIGVLAAAYQTGDHGFSVADEKKMIGIAEQCGIAVQNARLFESTVRSRQRYSRVLTALQYALSNDVRPQLNRVLGYAGMVGSALSLTEAQELAQNIIKGSEALQRELAQIQELATFSDAMPGHHQVCDPVSVVDWAVVSVNGIASERSISVAQRVLGKTYLIQGDERHLRMAISRILAAALSRSTPGAIVSLDLVFKDDEVIIMIRDASSRPLDMAAGSEVEALFHGSDSPEGEVYTELQMALASATIEAHRGSIEVRQAEPQGIEIVVRLPGMRSM